MLRSPAVCPAPHRRCHQGGLTLVELLVVIAIVATLAAIALGIIQGVRQYAAASHARADLAVLTQTLEQYRRQFGDYPQTADTPEKLYQALSGRLGQDGTAARARSLVIGLPLRLKNARPDSADNYFVDPWGNPYHYIYFTRQEGTAPLKRGYVLYSLGHRNATEVPPTRAEVVPNTSGAEGGVVSTAVGNAKNIYSGP